MPNTFVCREELFPTVVAERLLVNVWCWGLKLLPKTKIRWQHFPSLTQTLAKISCLTYPCDTPSLTAILCHVTITWWEAIIITVCSKSCWSFSYIVHIHSVHGFGEKDQNVKKWKFWSYSVEHCRWSWETPSGVQLHAPGKPLDYFWGPLKTPPNSLWQYVSHFQNLNFDWGEKHWPN